MEDQCSHALVTSELTGNMFLPLSPAWGGCCTLKMYWECHASANKQLLPMLDAPSDVPGPVKSFSFISSFYQFCSPWNDFSGLSTLSCTEQNGVNASLQHDQSGTKAIIMPG